ncbi:MAG: hypothetical protein AABZ60_05920 [Planctomycetota bacterium]
MSRKTFSLLEATISLFILTLALLALMVAISVKFRIQRNIQETQIALQAAKTKLQEWMTYPFIFRDLNTPEFKLTSDFLVQGLQPQEDFIRPGEVQINTFGSLPSVNAQGIQYIEIVVIVRWKGVSGSQRVVLQSQRFRTATDELVELESP